MVRLTRRPHILGMGVADDFKSKCLRSDFEKDRLILRIRLLAQDEQKGILIYGKSIAHNQYVIKNLEVKHTVRFADALPNLVNSATHQQTDLILFEMGRGSKQELNSLKTLISLLPEVVFLVILDNKATKEVAKILKYGVTDVFPKPYDPHLLVERVEALLKKNGK